VEHKYIISHRSVSFFQVKDASCSAELISDSNKVTTNEKHTAVPTDEIKEEHQEPKNAGEDIVFHSTARKKFDRSRTLALADEVLCG
jgi:hypothetical protein